MTTIAPPLPLADLPREPGVYDGIPIEEYHGDRLTLSSTGARKLLPPSTPAHFKWDLDHPEPPKQHFDLGTAAHKLVLGDGPDLVRIDADEWRSAAVKAEVLKARERGAIPLRPTDYQAVHDMADALRRHPLAAVLFDPSRGKPEQSLYWQDKPTGVQCRARLDWMRHTDGGRLLIPDYKTAASASRKKFDKAVEEYRYDQQADWYCDAVRQLGIAEDPEMVFVVQEKKPPYLVNVFSLTGMWPLMAEDRNKRAREIYKRCTATDTWPGYGDEVEQSLPPAWLETEHEREYR